MTVIPFPTRAASFEAASPIATPRPAYRALTQLLGALPSSTATSANDALELPPLTELLHALLDLADGSRAKALVPVVGLPLEVALVRRGGSALVSVYHTEASPSVLHVDRRVPLRALMDATSAALEEELHGGDDGESAMHRRLLTRAGAAPIVSVADDGKVATRVRGGAVDDPGEERPLAFGFEAAIFPGPSAPGEAVSHADVHAMLFSGQLWAWVRGRRIPIYKGPVLLAVQRMIAACGGFATAWQEGRAGHVRLRTGSFTIAMRGDREEGARPSRVSITLGSDEDGVVTVPQLEIPAAIRAVLRLGSEMLRALCAVDRSQTKNLRVRTLRSELRRISRSVRDVARAGSFTSADPDRLRMRLRPQASSAGDVSAPDLPRGPEPTHRLGWVSRWSVALPALDAEHSHIAGPLLIATTEDGLVAFDRETGDAVWQAPGRVALTLVSPLGVLTASETGEVIHRDLRSGDPLFTVRVDRKEGRAPSGWITDHPQVPPTALLCEGKGALTAIDLRTGELRWRFASGGPGALRVERAGRLVIVSGGDGAVSAIDVVTGRQVWRFADDVHVALAPAVSRDVVTIVSGEPGRSGAELCGLDLYSGALLYRRELSGSVEHAPIAADGMMLIAHKSGRTVALSAFDPASGEERWSRNDPGVAAGAGLLPIDGRLVCNAPNGKLTCVDLVTGSTRWQRVLSAAETDDVPRQLTPVLRAGALFVPSGTIHVLRPEDGASIGGRTEGGLPSDLLPDMLRTDERGWMYVGEESGHVVALAPAPRLTLLRSVRS